MRKFKNCIFLSISLITIVCASSAFAAFGYSTIKDPPSNGKSHYEILEDIYGGTFTPVVVGDPCDGVFDYVGSGGVDAYRVYDFDGEDAFTLNMLTGDQTGIDQVWTDGIAMVTAEAKYSSMGHTQTFGWNMGGTGTGTYQPLFDKVGEEVLIQITGDFLWSYRPTFPTETYDWWSLQSANDGGLDHMVTYKIEGAGIGFDETMWLIFMEDSPSAPANWDYNDFVVEVTAIVPEPATICLFGLGGLTLLRKRKK